ncbi:hypothetical protein ACFLU6_11875 [Acidobacteriota bacterium]
MKIPIMANAARTAKKRCSRAIFLWCFLTITAGMLLGTTASAWGGGELILSNSKPAKGAGARFRPESEHRPAPKRSYWLNDGSVADHAEAWVLHPDLTVDEISPATNDQGAMIAFGTPFGDGPMHGVHNVYVVDRQVRDGVLLVRVAQWLTIHHSCSWGHDYKYGERIKAKFLDSIPLEIRADGLWDDNFHSDLTSGDTLQFTILGSGEPVPGARVKLVTGRGWSKEVRADDAGRARFQLIRDYYPPRWKDFYGRHKDKFTVVAAHEIEQEGALDGAPYERIRLSATLPWRYGPSRQDYTSLSSGLYVGFTSLIIACAFVYVYRTRRKRPFREIVFDEKD